MPTTDRRSFLKSAAATAATLAAAGATAPHVRAADAKPLRAGLIGCGWYGKTDLLRLIQVTPTEVVSIADPDRKMMSAAAELIATRQPNGKQPRQHADYREMLKEKDLDVCLIATPDHWHALCAIDAMHAGCDLYLQKPISRDVLEGKAILDTARKLGRVVQIGTQRRSTPHLIDAIDKVIKPGLLGTVGHVDVCCYYHMRTNGNPPEQPVPDFFDYDLWTGPAPMRPFDGLPHLRWWRTFNEYCTGIMGDMCVHMLDTARWMLDLPWPSRITSNGGIFVQKAGKSNISDTQTALFEFDRPRLNVSWTHRTWGSAPDPEYPWAVFIYGDKGTLKASTGKFEFFPQGKKEATISGKPLIETDQYPEDKVEKDLEVHAASAIRWHMRSWLEARANRNDPDPKKSRPSADVEQGYISTASCILANISMDLNGRTLEWDPATTSVKNDPEANRRLKRPYRQGYTHPADAGA